MSSGRKFQNICFGRLVPFPGDRERPNCLEETGSELDAEFEGGGDEQPASENTISS
jgi:hypothetical protein